MKMSPITLTLILALAGALPALGAPLQDDAEAGGALASVEVTQTTETAEEEALEKLNQEAHAKRAQLEKQAAELERQKAESASQDEDLERKLAEAGRQLAEAEKQIRVLEEKLARRELQKLEQMKVLKRVSERPRLGVILETDPDEEVDPKGVLLRGVSPGGPADEAGLRAGDILTSINKNPLGLGDTKKSTKKIFEVLGEAKSGDTVTVDYLRGTKKQTAAVKVRPPESSDWSFQFQMPEMPKVPEMPEIPDIPAVHAIPDVHVMKVPDVRVFVGGGLPDDWYDVELVELNPDLGRYFGAEEGLLVVSAPANSSLKLKGGDVLLQIAGRKLSSPSQTFRILRTYEEGEKVTMKVLRDRKPLDLTVVVPASEDDGEKGEYRWEEKKVVRPRAPRAPQAPAPAPEAPAAAPAPVAPNR
ncbi:MAG: PDZ domain-containing protein [Acidobacteriota bacterium]